MSKYSKSKGSGYERVVSGLLDKWYGVPSKTFWRSRVSGAWIEQGDVVSRDKALTGNFPFIIECKFQKDLNLWAVVNNRTKNWFSEFWRQMDEELERDGGDKFQLLVFKTNRSPNYVSFDIEKFLDGGLPFARDWTTVKSGRGEKAILLWDEFVALYTPPMFKGGK